MNAHKAVLVVSLAVMILSVPVAALADGRRHHGWHGGRHHVSNRHHGHHHRHSHRHFYRPYNAYRYPGLAYPTPYFYGGGYYAGASSYTPPVIYQSAPVYDPPAVYTAPPAYTSVAVSPVALPPPRPSVIEYPTGRYELRGDGISTPYTWVWIPNPPPPPDVEPEPVAPPRSAPPSPRATAEAPARKSQLYRWVDAQGVVHLTDNPENVPEAHRKPAARAQPF